MFCSHAHIQAGSGGSFLAQPSVAFTAMDRLGLRTALLQMAEEWLLAYHFVDFVRKDGSEGSTAANMRMRSSKNFRSSCEFENVEVRAAGHPKAERPVLADIGHVIVSTRGNHTGVGSAAVELEEHQCAAFCSLP